MTLAAVAVAVGLELFEGGAIGAVAGEGGCGSLVSVMSTIRKNRFQEKGKRLVALPVRLFEIFVVLTKGVLITLLRILERGKVDSGVTYRRAEMNFDAVDHASFFYDRQQLGCLERMDEGERV